MSCFVDVIKGFYLPLEPPSAVDKTAVGICILMGPFLHVLDSLGIVFQLSALGFLPSSIVECYFLHFFIETAPTIQIKTATYRTLEGLWIEMNI